MKHMTRKTSDTLPESPLDAIRWQKVVDSDKRADGHFVLAVRTTGIYCRPSCPARRPKRENARFFDTPAEAETAGYRACKRCKPEMVLSDPRVSVVHRACRLIEQAEPEILGLSDLAGQVGYSPSHFQRMFSDIAGISPKAYGEALRQDRLRQELKAPGGVSDALYGAGYGAPSRLYEKASAHLGMTPASYAKGGQGARIAFATADSPLGVLLVAATEKGVCMVALGAARDDLIRELAGDFPEASRVEDPNAVEPAMQTVLAYLEGRLPHPDLPLDVRATAFQRQVWQHLSAIPPGETETYSDMAAAIGKPRAARAVGRACGANPVALVIPCHRALGKSGDLTGYRWGTDRKRALLTLEKAAAGGAAAKDGDDGI